MLLFVSTSAHAAAYDLVYGTVVNGASRATAGAGASAVEIVSVSTMEGVAASGASAAYQLEPVVASSTSSQSAIADWSLY